MHLGQTIQKAKSYGLEHIKVELINQDIKIPFSIKILRIKFGNSILDNSNWRKTSEGIIKKKINLQV